MTVTPELLGPLGLLVAALTAVGVLWKLHLDADRRERTQTDDWKAIAQTSTANTTKLADALEERNRIDEALQKAGR